MPDSRSRSNRGVEVNHPFRVLIFELRERAGIEPLNQPGPVTIRDNPNLIGFALVAVDDRDRFKKARASEVPRRRKDILVRLVRERDENPVIPNRPNDRFRLLLERDLIDARARHVLRESRNGRGVAVRALTVVEAPKDATTALKKDQVTRGNERLPVS
jgi:hypothetical protein